MSTTVRQQILACNDIRRNLKVSPHWSFEDKVGAMVEYWIGEVQYHFMANPLQMANELKRQGFIDKFYEGAEIVVEHEGEVSCTDRKDSKVIESLVSFMDCFSQSHWISLLVSFEFRKQIKKEMLMAMGQSKKYSKTA